MYSLGGERRENVAVLEICVLCFSTPLGSSLPNPSAAGGQFGH